MVKATYYLYQPAGMNDTWRWSIFANGESFTRNGFEYEHEALDDLRQFLRAVGAPTDITITDSDTDSWGEDRVQSMAEDEPDIDFLAKFGDLENDS